MSKTILGDIHETPPIVLQKVAMEKVAISAQRMVRINITVSLAAWQKSQYVREIGHHEHSSYSKDCRRRR